MDGISLLQRLCECDAVASREDEVRSLLYEELKGYCDEVFCDRIGSIIFHKKGEGPRLMLCAHMDEVGFLVQHIDHNGMLYLTTLGGVQALSQYMQKVHVVTADGKKHTGILMCESVDAGKAKEPYVDLGFSTAEQAAEAGIQIGDMVCFATEAELINKQMIAAKALDDRSGCFVLAQVLKLVNANMNLHCDLYIAFTTSEEVGLRGAKTASHMIQPDMAVAVDIGSTKNVFQNNFKNHRQLGSGPMLLHYDKGCIPTQKTTLYMNQLAKKENIALQQDMFSGGGTDIDQVYLNGAGTPGVVLGIPLHYAHGAYSLAHLEDIQDSIRLLGTLVNDFSQERYQELVSFLPK